MDALIGSTGFVGGTLARQMSFDDHFNSVNIETMRGRSYDLVVCAGARAEKWKANLHPEEDRRGIAALCDVLSTVTARRVVLISTVDVFSNPIGPDETADIPTEGLHPYGLHRRQLEVFVDERFPCTIVRLPALYGTGLRKNVIYDLLHDNQVEKIDSRGEFQFYGLDRLSADINKTLLLGLSAVHLVPEPVSVAEVARGAFGRTFDTEMSKEPPRYDVRTRHAEEFGGSAGYISDRASVVEGIRRFVSAERAAGRA
jgi:nucleoside-diphosphate-sugar epimerase